MIDAAIALVGARDDLVGLAVVGTHTDIEVAVVVGNAHLGALGGRGAVVGFPLAKVRDRIKRLFSPSPRDEQHSDPKSATHPTPPFFTIGRLHLSTSDAHYKEAISAVAYGLIINRPSFGGLN